MTDLLFFYSINDHINSETNGFYKTNVLLELSLIHCWFTCTAKMETNVTLPHEEFPTSVWKKKVFLNAPCSLLKWSAFGFFFFFFLWTPSSKSAKRGVDFCSLTWPPRCCLWDTEIKQLPNQAKWRGESRSVCYTTLSQRRGAVCAVIAGCWHTAGTGAINSFLIYMYIYNLSVHVSVCLWMRRGRPVHAGPDWPNNKNNSIITRQPQGASTIRNIRERRRRRRQGEEGSDERKKMGCLCLSPTYCIYVYVCLSP